MIFFVAVTFGGATCKNGKNVCSGKEKWKNYLNLWLFKVYYPLPPLCDPSACASQCIANGATGGICQVERDGSRQCICSYNPSLPLLCDPVTCSSGCIANGNGATGGICQVERDGSRKCMCMY